ncbi:hypothetical protein T440DRAFT_465209 [Plenodomus tracheiphilus IPT5]|uniref:Uncharacterized protein n=1 Tax=Plenodomus tracheiphilus IPT5 TaxID=1408161 RepID=A0A6A7BIJ6_9PLEO|nr:hypothetical protein T440DRAFT_465209 [Plenodomus tracheiphilus IPT5]
MPPRAKDPPRDRTPQSGRATSTSSSRARRLNGSFFENGSRSATSPPEARETRPATLPAAPAKWGVMRSAQISSPGVLPSLTPSSWATVRSAPTYTDVSSQAHKIGTAGRPPEPQSTTQPNLDTASSTTDPRIAEKQVASKTAKFEEEFERLLGLYATQDEIADNLRIINKNISEAGEDKKLADLKERESNALASLRLQHQTAETSLHSNHKRELEELTKRHDGQKKALIETGKAEIKKLHEDHASIRAKMQEETRGLQQDQKVKLQEKNAVSIELERKRKGYTEYEKNQIFDELARQLVKKRKITTEIKGEGDEKKA